MRVLCSLALVLMLGLALPSESFRMHRKGRKAVDEQPVYVVANQGNTCAQHGMQAVSQSACTAACNSTDVFERYSEGSWGHSPGCFVVVTGEYKGNCHWNGNAGAFGFPGDNRALCLGCSSDESCGSGNICDAGVCKCTSNESCGADEQCIDGACKAPKNSYKWGSIKFPVTFHSMSGEARFIEPEDKLNGKIPLIVNLHGSGGRAMGLGAITNKGGKKYLAKILQPRTSGHWQPDDLNKAIDHLLATDKDLDADRVYVTGFSLGGLGTWNLAKTSPDKLAAVVPVAFMAGGATESMINLPIWAICGGADRRRARTVGGMVNTLTNMGSTSVKATILPGVRHIGTSSRAWSVPGLVEWLFDQSLTKRI